MTLKLKDYSKWPNLKEIWSLLHLSLSSHPCIFFPGYFTADAHRDARDPASPRLHYRALQPQGNCLDYQPSIPEDRHWKKKVPKSVFLLTFLVATFCAWWISRAPHC